MPYKVSPEVIDPWRATLDKIVENARKNEITVLETDFPRETRWYLLQAFHAARELSVEPYNKVSVKIRRRGPTVLVVYPKLVLEELNVTIHTASPEFRAVPQHGVSSILALVSAVMNSKDDLLSFPDLEPSLKPMVYSWAEKIGHKILQDDPITIQRVSKDDHHP